MSILIKSNVVNASALNECGYHNNDSHNTYSDCHNNDIKHSVRQKLHKRQTQLRTQSCKQFGFSALELMFVLAVIAVAMVAILKTMGGNGDKVNATNMITDVSSMTQNIKSAYGSSSTGYTGLSNQVALSLKVVPETLPRSGNDGIKNQFQAGTVTIKVDSSDPSLFNITYTNVPSSVCQMVVTQIGSSAFQKIEVGSTKLYDAVEGKLLEIQEVGSACEAAKNKATITFTAS